MTHVSETPDSEDDLIEIVDSQPGVSCITLSDSDELKSTKSCEADETSAEGAPCNW